MPEFSTTVKMNTLISTFHFRLHNYTIHLSNVLKFSRRFATKWNLLCWKYKSHTFYFRYKHKIHELVIFNQTTKINAQEEKYFHSNSNIVGSGNKHHNPHPNTKTLSENKLKYYLILMGNANSIIHVYTKWIW